MLILISSIASGQNDTAEDKAIGTADQNEEWLTKLAEADRVSQLKMIRTRFFLKSDEGQKRDNYLPVIIINGLPFSLTKMSKNKREFLLNHLTVDHIGILMVVAQDPEELLLNKKFTGLIALTFLEKSTEKRWRKLN